jgi:metal-sulfur cluster biosynthetic enzyme
MSETDLNIPIWAIHQTHPDLVDQVRNSLSEVIDPEIGLNIIQLGLIRDVAIDPENKTGRVTMILTTPFCPYGPTMVDSTRQKAQEGLKMPATVEMGMDIWDFSMMEDPTALDWGLYN